MRYQMKTLIFVGALLIAAPTFAQSTAPKYKFSTDVQRQPVARGMDLVDGAVVCPSMDEATWMFGWINKARHARKSLSPELRRQAALVNGFDYGAEPRPSDYGCALVPAGTPLEVEAGNYVPIVSGVLPDGKKFKGVTIPNMIAR
jgi:prophage tail gpP-like protein